VQQVQMQFVLQHRTRMAHWPKGSQLSVVSGHWSRAAILHSWPRRGTLAISVQEDQPRQVANSSPADSIDHNPLTMHAFCQAV